MPNGTPTEKALYDLIERKHSEYKGMFSALSARLDVIEKHSAELDYNQRDTERRLEGGAKRFAEIEAITKPPLWRVVSLFGVLIGLVASLVWVAATYPDTDKVRELINDRSPYQMERGRILRVVEGYESTTPRILLQLGVIDVKLDAISKKLEER